MFAGLNSHHVLYLESIDESFAHDHKPAMAPEPGWKWKTTEESNPESNVDNQTIHIELYSGNALKVGDGKSI